MTVNISSDYEQLIADAIQAGTYETPRQMVERALEILREEHLWQEENKSEIDQKIARGLEQLDRGEFYTPEQSRADMEQRKAAWLRDRRA